VVKVPGYIQRSASDSLRYRTFREVVGLERGPLSLASTTEELLERDLAASVWKTENTAIGIRVGRNKNPSRVQAG
jgi:hypothetical protein